MMAAACAGCGAPIAPRNVTGKCKPCLLGQVVDGVRHERRPVPADFAANAHLRMRELAKRYSASLNTIRRWVAEAGIARTPHKGGSTTAPPPADLVGFAHGRSMLEIAAHYGRSRETVRRWLRDAGIHRPGGRWRTTMPRAAREPSAARPAFIRPRYGVIDRHFPAQSRPVLAAEHLRRFGPVTRCTASGEYSPHGDHWRRGNGVPLTADEIIERALRNGWRDPLARFDAPPATNVQTGVNA